MTTTTKYYDGQLRANTGLGLGNLTLSILLLVPDPPGVQYLGDGEYLIDSHTFSRECLGLGVKGQRKFMKALTSMLALGQIQRLQYDERSILRHMVYIVLPPLINNHGTRQISPHVADPIEVRRFYEEKSNAEAFSEGIAAIYRRSAAITWNWSRTGFDDTRIWDNVPAVVESWNKHGGSAGLRFDSDNWDFFDPGQQCYTGPNHFDFTRLIAETFESGRAVRRGRPRKRPEAAGEKG